MKTRRTIQFLHVRDSIKSVPDCAELSLSELQEKLGNKIPEDISIERYAAMVKSFAKGNTIWDDSY